MQGSRDGAATGRRFRRVSDAVYDFFIVRTEGEPRNWREAATGAATFLVAGVSMAAVVLLLLILGSQLYVRMKSGFGPVGTAAFLSSVVCSAGVGAHLFKQKNQFWYGMVEILIGAVSSFAISASMDATQIDFAKFASLVGAGYVIARGLGNRRDAIDKATLQKLQQAQLDINVPGLNPDVEMP